MFDSLTPDSINKSGEPNVKNFDELKFPVIEGQEIRALSGQSLKEIFHSGGTGIESLEGNIVNNNDPNNPVVNQQQADWDESDDTKPDFILNKPGSVSASATTTNATPTTITTTAIPTNKSVSINSVIRGVRTGGAGGNTLDSVYIVLYALFKNVAGTVTLVGWSFATNWADNPNCSAQVVVSGTNGLIQVIGDTANNYSWDCYNTILIK